MNSIWPQLNPCWPRSRSLPATSVARMAPSGPITTPIGWPGCSSTRTPTRSACPTRACRSSTRSSTSAPMRWPNGPTPPGSTSRRCCAPTTCRCSRSTPTGRRPPSTCWPSTCRPSSSTRTCSTASTWPACRSGRSTAAPSDPLVVAGGHCTYNPEPLADFLDVVVLGDGEEVVSEITEVVGEWKASGRTEGSRQQVLRRLARVPGVYVPSMYDVTYDGEHLAGGHPALRRRARRRSRSAPSPTWPTGPIPSASSCRSPRSCTTGSTSRCSGAAPAAAASARRA